MPFMYWRLSYAKRLIGHMMRGALACMIPWRLSDLPAFPPELVEKADLADRADRRVARRVGVIPGTGIPLFFFSRCWVMALLRWWCL